LSVRQLVDRSWTTQLLGRSVETVERWEALPCVVTLSGGYRIQIECIWRLLANGNLALTSEDNGQRFGHKNPVDAISELSKHLVGSSLNSVDVTPGTADLNLDFGEYTLQAISNSSEYEAWQVEGPQNVVAVGQGGGSVAVWE
jgi:hypothetical protein